MSIEVYGGKRVSGEMRVQGSKNAVLPMIAAAVLCDGEVLIENCPDITDVHAMCDVFRDAGGTAEYAGHCLRLNSAPMKNGAIREEKAGEIRASVLFLGSMLSRFDRVSIDCPGGCSIGSRPIDYHLSAFQRMGVDIREEDGRIRCETAGGLRGTNIRLAFPSVGATENILLAAAAAEGVTMLENAAREPEIAGLCEFLRAMGADIEGGGTNRIRIRGVKKLRAVRWRLGSDRIALLTCAMMVAGCGGSAFLETEGAVAPEELSVLSRLGCGLEFSENGVHVRQRGTPRAIAHICTRPYPGFPTDGQSLLMAVLCKSNGVSIIEESIFENRFRMIRQLRKMGANIDYVSNRASITGVTRLRGAAVEADDLRSGAGLLIAGAMADGVTEVGNEKYIERGYEDIVTQMRALGLRAERK